jgi:hypothetical protein
MSAVALSRIEQLEVAKVRLQIPTEDFDAIPARLDVTLTREGDEILLSNEQPGCALRFEVKGEHAELCDVRIRNDQQGRFFQQVLGVLLIEYQGDLDALIEWNAPKGVRAPVKVLRGETNYPLLASLRAARARGKQEARPPLVELGDEDTLTNLEDRVEKHLTSARAAWEEYQRLKASKDKRRDG